MDRNGGDDREGGLDMNIEEKNWHAFQARYPLIEIKSTQGTKRNEIIRTVRIESGEEIIEVVRNKRSWYLNSRIDPEMASKIYSDRYEKKLYQIYTVFGLGDGRSIRKIIEKCDDTNRFIIIEPDLEIFKESMSHFRLDDIIGDKRVRIFLRDIESIHDIVKGEVDFSKAKLIEYCILPGYDQLFKEECLEAEDKIIEELKRIMIMENTHLVSSQKIVGNILYNMHNMIDKNDIVQVKKELERMRACSLPAILVSAGPSLDKNIDELKRAQGKAMIIVVDAALRAVLDAGIRPDAIVSIDMNVPEKFFLGLELNDANWFCTRQTKKEILQKYGEKIFYYGYFTREWNKTIEERLGYEIPMFEVGGSVTSEAFMIAIYLGFTDIILVGQDMAFTGGKSHTKGIGDALGDNDKYIQGRTRVQIEGIDGGMVETDIQMESYKNWFEKKIDFFQGKVNVINATEGGALIKGAKNKKLRDVINDYCKEEKNFYDTIHEITSPFKESDKILLKRKINSMGQDMEELKDKISESIQKVEKIQKELSKPRVKDSKKKSCLIQIEKINEDIAKDGMFEWIQMYSAKEEYEFKEHIYQDGNIDEADLANRALNLYKSYYENAEQFFEDYEELHFAMQ